MEKERPEYGALVGRLREITGSWTDGTRFFHLTGRENFAAGADLILKGKRKPFVVAGDAVGAEAGHPDAVSHALVLAVTERELVENGAVACVGPDLDEAAPELRLPFIQVVLLALAENAAPDPFALESTQYLANRLPGFMARAVPGRLWIRVSKEAVENGFRMNTLGAALIAAYNNDFPEAVEAVEVILVTGDEKKIKSLELIVAEAGVMSGKHRKLVLSGDGIYDCPDLDCTNCDTKAVCDALRDITVRYRKRSPV